MYLRGLPKKFEFNLVIHKCINNPGYVPTMPTMQMVTIAVVFK